MSYSVSDHFFCTEFFYLTISPLSVLTPSTMTYHFTPVNISSLYSKSFSRSDWKATVSPRPAFPLVHVSSELFITHYNCQRSIQALDSCILLHLQMPTLSTVPFQSCHRGAFKFEQHQLVIIHSVFQVRQHAILGQPLHTIASSPWTTQKTPSQIVIS